MTVTEARRIALLEAAQHALGREVAITLMEMLPPSGWGDVATRQRVDALEHDMRLQFDTQQARNDARFDVVDAPFDGVDGRFDSFASEIHSEMRAGAAELRADIAELRVSTTRWAVGTILSVAGVGAAVVGVLMKFG